jgi:hypothetical protein
MLATAKSSHSPMALPGGGWLESLQLLMLGWADLNVSLPVLEAAPHLEVVASNRCLVMYTHRLSELIAWAGKRQQLRRLVLPIKSANLYLSEKEKVAKMLRRHPGITFELPENSKQLKESTMLLAPDLADWIEEG